MEAKFTHTEWQRAGTTVYALNIEGSNRFSALVQGGWATDGRLRTDDAELVANARLIAAAPELLEALRPFAALDLLPGRFDLMADSQVVYARDKSQITVGDVRRALQAISKATGEQA